MTTFEPDMSRSSRESLGNTRIGLALLLLLAVAARAFGGTAVSFPWKTGPALTIALTLCVAGGKALGGFALDRLGIRRVTFATAPAAAVLIAFCSAYMLPGMLGQLLLNMTMPITLYLVYKALPGQPGLAFGLAASALWPGHLAGSLLYISPAPARLTILLCVLAGLAAIVYSDNKLKGEF